MVSALYEAGFLKLRKDGLWSLYSIDKDAMKGYRSDLVQAVKKALEGRGVAERVGPWCRPRQKRK